MKLISYLIFGLICLAKVQSVQAQDLENQTPNHLEKIHLGVGIGVDHANIGFKLEYQFAKNLTVYTALGTNQRIKIHIPPLGIRYNFKREVDQKLIPYCFGQIGHDHFVILNKNSADLPINIANNFGAINLGCGLSYPMKFRPNLKLNIGISYKFINEKSVDEYIEAFNEMHQKQYRSKFDALLPVIGFRISFTDLDKSYT